MASIEPYRVCALWSAILVSVLLGLSSASADYVVLKDGRYLTGQVVEETTDSIRFETEVNGIRTTITYSRNVIDHYVIEEDDGPVEESPQESRESPAPAPSSDRPPSVDESQAGPLVMVVPLHGRVGGMVNGSLDGTFDALFLQECFREAEREGADLVILDIDSPGGLVSEMDAICEMILNWRKRIRIAAFVREALSAAAIIALTCPDLAVQHDARLGGAVIISVDGSGGVSAVDAKFASVYHARQRQYMAASGQPYEVVQAMTIHDTELWWSPRHGFRTSAPSDRDAGWEQLTTKKSVLTMTGDQLRRYGLATVDAGTHHNLVQKLGIAGMPDFQMMFDALEDYNVKANHRVEQINQKFERYFSSIRELRRGLFSFIEAAKANDRRGGDAARSRIRRAHGAILNINRGLRQADRSLVARRVSLHELFIERLEEDAELLGRLRRLIDTNTYDGLVEAAERFDAVIEGWMSLFGD